MRESNKSGNKLRVAKNNKPRSKITAEKKSNKATLGQVLINRSKLSHKKDLVTIWQEQKDLAKAEDHRFNQRIKNIKKRLVKSKKIIPINKLKTKTPFKLALKSNNYGKYLIPKKSIVAFVLILLIGLIIINRKDSKEILGDSTTTANLPDVISKEENRISEDQINFKTLSPNDAKEGDIKYVSRQSPSGIKVYSYQDSRNDMQIEVTEQEIPDSFKGKESEELKKIADTNQQTGTIQLNEVLIYHGYNEKYQVQTLTTYKENLLIFIRSNKKMSDEFWVSYYLSLE